MIINERCFAPQIGVWNVTKHQLPEMGQVVVGLGWASDGFPQLALMEWHIVEDGDDYNSDNIFLVADKNGEHQEKDAGWFLAGDDENEPVAPPTLWAETRFTILTPFKVCGECSQLEYITGDDEDEDEEGFDDSE